MNSEKPNKRITRTVVALPGEGVGPEVTIAASAVLEHAAALYGLDVRIEYAPFGAPAFEETGSYFPTTTRDLCAKADALLLGAVERGGLLELRREFDFFANLRPVKAWPQLLGCSGLRRPVVRGVDIMFVRELTSGIHFGPAGRGEEGGREFGYHTMKYFDWQLRRIAEVALEQASARRGRLTVAHKENALPCIPWCELVREQGEAFSEVEIEELLVDNLSMQLVTNPAKFDVVLSGNLIGDWLSSLGGGLLGSIGLLPSASLNADGFGLFEPIHGTAPEIAGQDVANPLGAIISTAMMLEQWEQFEAGRSIRRAALQAVEDGVVTADIAGRGQSPVGTAAMSEAICSRLKYEIL